MKSPRSTLRTPRSLSSVTLVALAGALAGCSSSSTPSSDESPDGAVVGDGGVTATDFVATDSTFTCLKGPEWTQVGLAFFKNMLGHTDEMLAVARSADGGTFPPGTVVQLIPTEASVKRAPGFAAQSHDWEFFTLGITSAGATIKTRGGDATVVNAFNGSSCLGCHGAAAPQWDLLCGDADGGSTNHGCASLGPLVTPSTIGLLQSSDQRCK